MPQSHPSPRADDRAPWNLKSLRVQLSAVFVFCLLLLGAVGLSSMTTLYDVNSDSRAIREHWMQGIRILGDLNNFTSDYRAAEASHLLAADAGMPRPTHDEIQTLDASIKLAMRNYEGLHKDHFEVLMYARFKTQWQLYLDSVRRVFQESGARRSVQAQKLFLLESRDAYEAASDTLGKLTSLTVAAAGEANDHANRTYRQARLVVAGAIVLAVLCVVAMVLYINHSVTGPLSDLAQNMRELSAHHTDIVISGKSRSDEIGEMARAVAVFRNNAIELAQSQLGLIQQATMLEEKLEQEQRLSTLQRNFVSMVSHEFRTPLTIIDGHAQRLIKLKDALQPGGIEERALKMRSAVLRMTRVMETLLTSSRLFEGNPSLHFHPRDIDPAKLLHDVCHLHREIAPGANIYEDFRHITATLHGDLHLLFQALSNLLSNALKYSPQGSEVRVSARVVDHALHIHVEDHGLGIPAEDLPGLFERYHRGHNVSDIPGTGIGLYLVKMVVQLHQGRIDVESRLGRGSEFVMRLPLVAG